MSEPLLSVNALRKSFGHGLTAVAGASFDIAEGTTMGVVGESGSGKSTLARLVLRLIEPDSGVVRFAGRDLLQTSKKDMRSVRASLQFVPQHPATSLNPRATVGSSIKFVMRAHGASRRTLNSRVDELLQDVGLAPEVSGRFPHQLSGGQLQRIAIARAVSTSPKLIVCDEPVSALDKSVQAQVLNMLANLQAETGIALLFITHDLAVAEHMADNVLVMNLGEIVERGDSQGIWRNPQHPYTRQLLAAIPGRRALETAIPSIDPPTPVPAIVTER